jgi:predicted permease
MASLVGSLRYAVRQFRLSPVFTATAVLTLALGIGGTTAIFTLIHAVMLRSLPVTDPARLYRVGDGADCCVEGGPQDRWGLYSFPLYERIRAGTPEFEAITAFQAGGSRLSVRRQGAESAAWPLRSEYVTGSYFSTLGIRALSGRVLTEDDDRPAAVPVAVLSHHAWQTHYGSDPSVVGASLTVEGHPFTVIGVAPPGFFGETLRPDPPDMWIPLQQEPLIAGEKALLNQPVSAWLRVVGRLRPGASVDGMAPRLTAMLRSWIQHDSGYPSNWMPEIVRLLPRQTIAIVPAGAGVGELKEEYGRSLRILLVVCGLVLLIACANVANLLLARAAVRRGQTALRLALGAPRRQIILQALVESVLLSLAGGIVGLAVAVGAARLLLYLAFRDARFLPITLEPSLVVLAFAFGVALVTGAVFGVAPAWVATRTAPIEALRRLGRSGGDRSSLARAGLLIAQATISVVLVAGATMLARSLDKLQGQDFGYQVPDRIVVSINRPPATYALPQLMSLYRELEDRLDRLPGVRGSGLALYNPLTDNWGELIFVSGHQAPTLNNESGSSWDRVSSSYLQSLGVRLVRGRHFSAADNESAPLVAIVNEAFVKRFFTPSEEPVGQHFGLDLPENAGTYTIVGVVRDAKFAGFGLERPARPTFFVPLAQNVPYTNPLMARIELSSHFIGGMLLVSSLPPATLEPALRKAVASVDQNLTINTIRTLQQQVELSFNQERAVATLAGLFGVVALLLAVVGLYGVTAYAVAQRTGEIGIRMALGADRTNVAALVLVSAFKRVAAGLVLGIPLAVGAGRLISAQLYGVTYWDPLALAVAIVSLSVCALIAAFIPARRAAGVSPMTALRTE